MARYSLTIGYNDDAGTVHQVDHDSGVAVRTLCPRNLAWTPANSNFDTVTGLPTSAALGATEVSNPCSLAATSQIFYLLDPWTCRVLAIDPATNTVWQTFGGRRGIGTGRISPDATRRSIVAAANGKIFVTDNDDGSGGSGNGFVVQYSESGAFEAQYSIASWITALSASATFDQVTGWAYDTARVCYWALASGSANVYLLRIDTTGTPTGEVINLTTRLASSLGITVSGHGGTEFGRTRTRGLYYHNGQLIFTSENRVIRIDLTNTDGDALLSSQTNDVGPGNWTSDGTEFSFVLRDQANGSAVVYVLTVATGTTRTYGDAQSPPTGVAGQISEAWDLTVVPTSEDPSTRTSRTLQLRASIQKTTSQTIDMRAAIVATVTRTLQMRARILSLGLGSQRQLQMRARIEESTTLVDGVAVSWDLEDSLGTYSRGLRLRTVGRAGLQVGNTVTLYAGYGTDRVKIFHGEIDDVANSVEPDSSIYEWSLRDVGAKEAGTRQVTFNPPVQFPRTTNDVPSVTANEVLANPSAFGTLAVGGGFQDYALHGNVSMKGTPVQILSQLVEPWNQFASLQHYPTVREGRLFMRRINWREPPSGGYEILRGRIKSMTRKQTRYLSSPNLVGFALLQVKGATVTLAIIDQLGPQTKIEYFRNLAQGDVTEPSAANTGSTTFLTDAVLTETTSVEELWGDKVLSRTSETYETRGTSDPTLISREVEETLYFEPPGELGFDSIQTSSAGPSPLALPYQTNSTVSGIDPVDNQFREVRRTQTNYYYDESFQLAAETINTSAFDVTDNRWKLESVQHRTHSETTGGSTRIHRYDFANSDGVLTYDTSDSQQVGGRRPNPATTSGLASVVTSQAMAPQPQVVVDVFGSHVVEISVPGPVWSYENPTLGQEECEQVQGLAAAEQGLQSDATKRWEDASLVCVFDPNLHSGMAVRIEVEAGTFADYWAESVNHSWTAEEALTRLNARRITSTPMP